VVIPVPALEFEVRHSQGLAGIAERKLATASDAFPAAVHRVLCVSDRPLRTERTNFFSIVL